MKPDEYQVVVRVLATELSGALEENRRLRERVDELLASNTETVEEVRKLRAELDRYGSRK